MSTPLATIFLNFSTARMRASQKNIVSCLDRLNEQQMQQRGGDWDNSIVNLLLHLEGNIRQWVIHGVGGQLDVRRRDEEFSLAPGVTAEEARARFERTIDEAEAVILACDPAFLSESIDPQPTGAVREPKVLEAIYRVVSHLDHHTGQIILLTKQLLHSDLDLSMPRKR